MQEEPINPCEPSPCGSNAICTVRNGVGTCKCIEEYQGNPYERCRPECVLSSDCPSDKTCIRNKCKDPCPGICGLNAQCYATNHVPNCVCNDGFVGDPFSNCHRDILPTRPTIIDPCNPSPCGPNSKCRISNKVAVCSCLDNYIGSPPNCKPECSVNAECPQNKACHKFKCSNPCSGTCGLNAKCNVINHNPICSCLPDLTGDPFTRCYEAPKIEPSKTKHPCIPSPCGLYSECRAIGDSPSCSCLPNYIGSPPNCRPECIVNTDCPSDKSCIAEKCRNPCEGSCGVNTDCRIQNHVANCICKTGFTGDPFTQCVEFIEPLKPTQSSDPCELNPCGSNANCENGICSCIKDYRGDPYVGCRPECTVSTDCSPSKTCINKNCVNPCPGTCGENAQCDVSNHIPICSCSKGYVGDPFVACRPEIKHDTPSDPCKPSPCGPNSICNVSPVGAVCACQMGMLGSPPSCKPECIVSAECPLQKACLQKKCVDPCPGACGFNAKCQVINHAPVCSCNEELTGDPFVRCYEMRVEKPTVPVNPCIPSPCGPNSDCKIVGDSPACSCLPSFIGTPPNCRPECTINPECPSTQACINQKCADPCIGSCGVNTRCTVANHMSICSCNDGFSGDPFLGCSPITAPPKEQKHPCNPSPCGTNTYCRVTGNNNFICECIEDYIGNPYDGCRPECIGNSECPSNKACIKHHCKDPCPGTCGYNAICTVTNHIPICSCPPGQTGNAFTQCFTTPTKPKDEEDPCYPTPCGLNSVCKNVQGNAICNCIPGYFGNPNGYGCKPECTLSSDCSKDKACVNHKCVNPCVGVCGYRAVCKTINHNPICSCPKGTVGNPFEECHEKLEPINPCYPPPCKNNGICKVVNDVATCIYPECVTNEDCARNRACINQKCRDPCLNACGLNAVCNSVNHKSSCTCPQGYYGSPYVECLPQIEPISPKPECLTNEDCTNDKACINNECINPCDLSSICGYNAECHVVQHHPLCVQHEIGCRSDNECSSATACINRQCLNPCQFTQCGIGAICRTDYNHKARCYCPEEYKGNPLIRCERPECTSHIECSFNLACINEKCQNPCNCGEEAECRVDNHQAQCKCASGYTGNPLVKCTKIPVKDFYQCTMDSHCPSKLACFNGECKNPCILVQPCGTNAFCTVVDTLPLRTMICQCEPGYIGDANIGCKKVEGKEPGCQSYDDCQNTEVCRSGYCVNPCVDSSPCARTAECLTQNHKAICRCPPGLQGDPFINCYEVPITTPECTQDSDCLSLMACINERCQNPCAESNPCTGHTECRVSQHRPLCYCPIGWGGDPQVQCYKPECKSDVDCPFNKACINQNCLDPCTYNSIKCGIGAQCTVNNHQMQCICPSGTQGNPFISCITGLCQYNEDCADHEACDRLNRICRPVCDDDTCAVTAICVGRNHQPSCECRPGTTGNPYVECFGIKISVPTEPECRIDGDCPSQLACVNNRCSNPCNLNVCTQQQTCTVLDTLPLRTIICKCPNDMLTDNARNCIPIKQREPKCKENEDCEDADVCQRGSCVNACYLDKCGINAICRSTKHFAHCSCAPGYEGNPRIECNPISKIPLPSPECYKNDDCPNDETCYNERCVNPCIRSNPCGQGAFCHTENREPICRCPNGYAGDPKTACVPPSQDVIGCRSNSDCVLTESCINEVCVNPCNCGPNAECTVVNHHPVCFCKPGYSGNAHYSCFRIECLSDDDCSANKQCINHECINPCILDDPCAINAECYGRNHRAACRCPNGLEGDPYDRCLMVECHSDYDCSSNQACFDNRCINPCADASNPCAQNAICFAINHLSHCRCPDDLPMGNPYSYCERKPVMPSKPECTYDLDCPSKLACINNKCVNPCIELSPCANSAHCSVLDSIPVRTMVCECPELYVPDINGECKAISIQIPPGCLSDIDCSDKEACINRQCRNPCNCGTNAICTVQNHRGTCSCDEGFEGNPHTFCRTVGCRIDRECESGKACINGNCINPCVTNNPCGVNAECYVSANKPSCKCLVGYRGNPYERCIIIGCRTNNDCPSEKTCINEQCINPCIYKNPCSPHAECRPQNHIPICKCPVGFFGNPYIDCKAEELPECVYDIDCSSHLACLDKRCQDPCLVLEPCSKPARCEVTPTSPVRTMLCVCPEGYVSSGSGTCKPTSVIEKSGCIADSDCASDRACINGICRDPCNCGINAECRIKNHKPVCSCKQGYEGNAEFECVKIGCKSDDECATQHSCINRQCVPVCAIDGSSCGQYAECYGINHKAICECREGFSGNPRISCVPLECQSNDDCPFNKACFNNKCQNPCETTAVCAIDEICKVYQHRPECACPPGYIATKNGCKVEIFPICTYDSDCPPQTACLGGECVNPCNATQPCGVNTKCRVLDTLPVRTMICECLEGYQGNAAIQCDKRSLCHIEKGFVRDIDGRCVCPPGTALDVYEYCVPCEPQKGFKVDETGHCICDLERGMIIDIHNRCTCPEEHGYRLTENGECLPVKRVECETNDDCASNRYCNIKTKTCEDPCLIKICGANAFCNATNHQAVCECVRGYTGNPETACDRAPKAEFPIPEMKVSCLADGVQVRIHLVEPTFNGVLYVKGHSKEEECRRIINSAGNGSRTEVFKVRFGSCGLIHVNGIASFVLVIQPHPKLVTFKAQAYNVKCVYQTGERNVTLGFNVSMLTTAGTIANTGPPPICQMRIVTHNGQEINSAEIGDNLMLQVDVEPATIYGGFARSCIAKTMEDSVENEYIVTDENGCATDPSIFGEWEYNPETNSLMASFNAFKFPSSDNIKFQCNIRVCFGKCQPVNCRGYNAFGRRRKREITYQNSSNPTTSSTAIVPNNALGIEGQLREEITIQSNAILTFERREDKFGSDSQNIKPAAQRVEDICVSMVGLIIALVITALLALVAVAVAVSCWLMAYRRQPKTVGPLPHPPEFPNPLFANPDAVPEPTPDYLS